MAAVDPEADERDVAERGTNVDGRPLAPNGEAGADGQDDADEFGHARFEREELGLDRLVVEIADQLGEARARGARLDGQHEQRAQPREQRAHRRQHRRRRPDVARVAEDVVVQLELNPDGPCQCNGGDVLDEAHEHRYERRAQEDHRPLVARRVRLLRRSRPLDALGRMLRRRRLRLGMGAAVVPAAAAAPPELDLGAAQVAALLLFRAAVRASAALRAAQAGH